MVSLQTKIKSQKPTAIIFGGANFIGRYLSQNLLSKYSKVIVIDKLKPTNRSYRAQIKTNSNISQISASQISPQLAIQYVFFVETIQNKGTNLNLSQLVSNAEVAINLAVTQGAKFLFATPNDVLLEKQSKQKLSNLLQVNQAIQLLINSKATQSKLNARTVYLSNLYGPENHSQVSPVSYLFKDLESNKIMLAGDGQKSVSPFFVKDAAEALIQAMFSQGSMGKSLQVVSTGSQPLLNVAYLIKSQLQQKGVEATITSSPTTFFEGEIELPITPINQPTSLEEGIEQTIMWGGEQHSKNITQKAFKSIKKKLVKKPKYKKSINQISKKKIILFTFIAFTLIFISPFVVTKLSSSKTIRLLEQHNYKAAQKSATTTISASKFSRINFKLVSPLIGLINQDLVEAGDKLLGATTSTFIGISQASQAAISGNLAVNIGIGNEISDPFPHYEAVSLHLSRAFQELSIAQTTLQSINVNSISWFGVADGVEAALDKLPGIRQQIIVGQIMPPKLGL